MLTICLLSREDNNQEIQTDKKKNYNKLSQLLQSMIPIKFLSNKIYYIWKYLE